KNKSGRIIFIGSESAINAGKKGTLYSSAKFGIRGLALALREDCSKDGINVSLINPGMVKTPFFDNQNFQPGGDTSNYITPQDIAETVLHILQSNPDIVLGEINISPRNKSITFKA
ncbi:MAG: SDR family NAD(P)-dependent oxidoreductase, partial [Gammaproteobacteria bacterium]|nr:SDR family NAD(P)-dependent oxidoreductase [Gammaproteobacteria bacterium]